MVMDNGSVVYYVIKANGVNISPKFQNKMVAEMEKQKLSDDMKMVAEIVPVTSDGLELLLG